MSYEKELLEVAIYQCGKLTPNEEDRLYKWIESLEVAKRKADEYEAKAKAFDEVSFIFVDSIAHDYDDHSIVQNIARVIEKEKGDYYV